MTKQEKQKLKDVLIEHKNIAASEYNDEDAFVGIYFCDLVDIIDGIIHNIGWHPASEPPEYAQEVIVLFKHGAYHDYPLIPMKFKYLGKWFMDVKWWCYPPKEDKE